MKIFHISDLHIGKQLNYYSLKENQTAVLEQVIEKMKEHRPDVLLIAGDIYDKAMPSGEAYKIFDLFLQQISEITPIIPVFIIAGNHDSPERLNYASSFMEKHHIHISVMPPQQEDEYLKKVILEDAYGPVNFYFLPFMKPGYVRHLFPEQDISDYEKAVRAVLEREEINFKERNVILSHQFYQGQGWDTATCDSEQVMLSIGGLDRIDISLLENFDYAALGHLHGPQQIKSERIRYSGSPLKYSVSEEHQKKSITMITLGEKGSPLEVELLPLRALQDVRSERGRLEAILERAKPGTLHDFISVTVTDETEPYRMKEQLREIYDFILDIHIDNQRTRKKMEAKLEARENLSPKAAFGMFYEEIMNAPLGREEEELLEKTLDRLTEERE
ncbi:MAG: exonuclease SbcCD subunit D [Clostridia bacterium]|nr:exonuclease SbcCD subunit D [Lachnospiraceae bacterium]NCB99816.1 exonuclease SbcCD subunit D [Clostridia bacterium]NCD01963.1 exonuclease SbcCD subunit D [Clostridia bacterium]